MTDLRAFSSRYVTRDDGSHDPPWSLEIPGKLGAIYPHGASGSLAVLTQSSRAIRKLVALGLKVVQRGDTEAAFMFDPRQIDQVAAIIQAKRRRRLSPEHRAAAVAALARARMSAYKKGPQPPGPSASLPAWQRAAGAADPVSKPPIFKPRRRV